MKKTAIVYSPRYLVHDPGPDHPESPRRLNAIMEGLRENALYENKDCSIIEPRPAGLRDLELVHRYDYVKFVRKTCQSGGGQLNEGTAVSRESFEAARLAVGGVVEALNRVMGREFHNAFALVRPPGHHAGPGYALGFCIFNNVAVAAAYLLSKIGLNRILILDIDAHHGNGTQEIFYDTDKVLFMSLHEDPSEFPGTGFISETGRGKGLGYTVNIPLPFWTGDRAYLRAMKSLAIPIVQQYEPQFILVSAGFDGYYRDSVGELSLSAYIYPRVFQMILDLAHDLCEDRIVAVLEGGYNLRFLERIVPVVIAKMAGLDVRVRDKRPLLSWNAQKRAERILEDAKRVQSRFWQL